MQRPYQAEMAIPVNHHTVITGDLLMPQEAKGLVIITHCGNQHSTRYKIMADYLVHQGFAALTFDLLKSHNTHEPPDLIGIRLMAEQLIIVSEWLLTSDQTSGFQQAYLGFSTAAAIALYAAAAESTEIAAVVSISGRTDLAMEVLSVVQSPILLIVGSDESEVIALNHAVLESIHCTKRLEVIPGASHLFEEKGALEKVCVQTSTWLEQYLHPIKLLEDR